MWTDYLELGTKKQNKLARDAERGNIEAIRQLKQYTNEIKTEVNKRLRSLEQSGYDNSKQYNDLVYFTQTEYNSNRFQSPKSLEYDAYSMKLQNNIGIQFLKSNRSTVKGSKESDNYRLKRLQEMEVIPKNIGKRKATAFLKFLNNEEFTTSIDEYGKSDVVVDMVYDVYEKDGLNGLNILKRALAEHFANPKKVTFDEAMERVGIKVEDYIIGKPTS